MSNSTGFSPAPRRPQFSLRTAFLLVVLAAAGASLWISYQQSKRIDPLRAEINRLKSELGELVVEPGQENKLHAIAVPTLDEQTWKWRVYIPPGRPFLLNHFEGSVPENGKAKTGVGQSTHSQGTLSAGELVITAAVRKNPQGKWQWIVSGGSTSSRSGVFTAADKLLSDGNYGASSSGLGTKQVTREPGQELELLRFRMFPRPDNGSYSTNGPGEGIMIWISEEPAGK